MSATYKHTQHPNLWRYSYWGQSAYGLHSETAIKNRNEFATQCALLRAFITPSSHWPSFSNSSLYDHFESYLGSDGRAYLFYSAYDQVNPHIEAKALGFRKVLPLYSETTTTFLAVFPGRVSLRLALKYWRDAQRNVDYFNTLVDDYGEAIEINIAKGDK